MTLNELAVAAALCKYRFNNNMSKKDASSIFPSVTRFSLIESGKSPMKLGEVYDMADKEGIDVVDLLVDIGTIREELKRNHVNVELTPDYFKTFMKRFESALSETGDTAALILARESASKVMS